MALEHEIALRTAELAATTTEAGQVSAASASISAAVTVLTGLPPVFTDTASQLQALLPTVHDQSSADTAWTQALSLLRSLQQKLQQTPGIQDAEKTWQGVNALAYSRMNRLQPRGLADPRLADPLVVALMNYEGVVVGEIATLNLGPADQPPGSMPANQVVQWLTEFINGLTALAAGATSTASQLAGLGSWAAVLAAAQAVVSTAQASLDAANRLAAALSTAPVTPDAAALTSLLADLAGLRVTAWPVPLQAADDPTYKARMAELDAALRLLLAASIGGEANTPAVLLPVRLETRIAPSAMGGTEVRIRVHVDDVHVDAHDPRLTEDEVTWSQHLRAAVAAADDTAGRVWAQTAARFGAARAAYLLSPQSGADTRASVWQQPAVARCLPERWLAVAYGPDETLLSAALGQPITVPLHVGPDPTQSGAPIAPGDVPVDPGLRWLVNFDAAVAAGMGIRLQVDGSASRNSGPPVGNPPTLPPPTTTIGRIIVVGINTGDGAKELARLLEAHHFTDGLELLAPGTPTNNTPEVQAGRSSADPGFTRSFQRELGGGSISPAVTADAARLAGALGIDPAVLGSAGGPLLGSQDQQAAIALCWPATWGKFLRTGTGLVSVADAARLERVRSWAVAWLRPGGPLPTLRIGAQPYGVLPILALENWADPNDPVGADVQMIMSRLLPGWASLGEQLMHAKPDFNSLLERRAVSAEVGGRFAGVTTDWLDPNDGLLDVNRETIRAREDAVQGWQQQIETLLGTGAVHWPSGYLVLPDILDNNSKPWPLTTPDGVAPLVGNGKSEDPDPYLVALAQNATPSPIPVSVLGFLAQSAANELGGANGTSAAFVPRGNLGEAPEPAAPPPGAEWHAAVAHLAERPSADVAEPFGGALDIASSRLDPWVTALATSRLGHLRANSKAVLVGGFGWVEDLHSRQPLAPPKASIAGEPSALEDPANAGFIHAPSLQQATTAAVLRSGYLTHNPPGASTGEAAPLAIDLSSRRARLATWLLDGVRQGQPLAALLGYRFERALQEPPISRPDLIDDIRKAAPYDPALPTAGASPGAAEAVRATDVVDGVTLYERYQHGDLTGDIRPGGSPWTDVGAALAELADTVDAVADGALAQALHDSLTGNITSAVSGLDAIATGSVPPPELAFLQTPRTGIAINHRVLVPVPPGAGAPAGWSSTPRGRAEPSLSAWAGALLGDPSTTTGTVALLDADGNPLGGADAAIPITLDQLGLGPLDLLAISERPAELEQLAVYTALAGRALADPPATGGRLNDTPPGAQRALGDVMAIARAAARLLASSRAADARDLAPAATQPDPRADINELAARVAAAEHDLDAAASALATALPGDPPPLSAQPTIADVPPDATPAGLASALLLALKVGVPGAAPAGLGTDALEALVGQARNARAEIARRQATVAASAPPDSAEPGSALRSRLAQLRTAFGGGFTALAQFTTDPSDLLVRANAMTTVSQADAAQTPYAWIAKVAHARGAIADLLDCCSTAEVMGGPSFSLAIGQLPLPAAPAPWAAQPFPAGLPPAANTLSLVFAAATVPAAGAIGALVVDDWIEVIPNRQETTGITYHYNTPGAQAPQSILIAVPPTPTSPAWTYAGLLDALEDTIRLTRARTVDYADLPSLYKLMLPAIYLQNPNNGMPPAVPMSVPAGPDKYLKPWPGPTIQSVTPINLQQGSTGTFKVTGLALASMPPWAYHFAIEGVGIMAGSKGITPLSTKNVTPPGPGQSDVIELTVSVDPNASLGTHSITVASSPPFANGPTVTWRPRVDSCGTAQLTQGTGDRTIVINAYGQLLVSAAVALTEQTSGLPYGEASVTKVETSETSVAVTVAIPGSPRPTPDPIDGEHWPRIKPPPVPRTPSYFYVNLQLTVTPFGGSPTAFPIGFQGLSWD